MLPEPRFTLALVAPEAAAGVPARSAAARGRVDPLRSSPTHISAEQAWEFESNSGPLWESFSKVLLQPTTLAEVWRTPYKSVSSFWSWAPESVTIPNLIVGILTNRVLQKNFRSFFGLAVTFLVVSISTPQFNSWSPSEFLHLNYLFIRKYYSHYAFLCSYARFIWWIR